MNLFALTQLLAAADSAEQRYRSIHQYLRQPHSPWWQLWFWGAALAVATALLIAGIRYARRQRNIGNGPTPWGLFFNLLLHAPLNWRQRWMLIGLAKRTSRACPAAILLTPSALLHAARQWAEQTRQPSEALIAQRIAPVARVLFEDPPGQA